MSQLVRLGFYSHYKGGLYLAVKRSKFSEDTKKNMVLYLSLHYWVWYTRPEEMWFDPIKLPDGTTTTRFRRVGFWHALKNLKWKR